MESILETPGARLEITDSGPGRTDHTLLFLHYWGGSAATWRKVVGFLDDDVRCIAVSQRGWGGSVATDGRYDLAAMAEDVLAVIRQFGLARVVLVGHSMGGKVAQIVAARKPRELAGLVLVAPAPPTPMPVPAAARMAMLASYGSVDGVAQALTVLAGPNLPQPEHAGIVADTLGGLDEAKREWTERGMITDLGLKPGDITVPTAILVGPLDRVETPERLQAAFATIVPGARFTVIDDVGHLSPLEAPGAVAAACRSVLATIVSSS